MRLFKFLVHQPGSCDAIVEAMREASVVGRNETLTQLDDRATWLVENDYAVCGCLGRRASDDAELARLREALCGPEL